MKTVLFSPVFNQAQEFPRVLDELKSMALPCDEVLLINNGSSDGSEEMVHKSGYPYLDIPKNRGVGHSYIVAIDWAMAHGFDVLVALASNGKMLPDEMGRLLAPILAGEAEYVTGSRFLEGGRSPNLPAFRERSIPLVNGLVRTLTGVALTDATCGYRAYALDLVRRANFNWRAPWLWTYSFEYYLYAKVLLDHRINWKEVPVTMRYPPKGHRYSKICPGRDWWAMLNPWIVARVDGKGFAPREKHSALL